MPNQADQRRRTRILEAAAKEEAIELGPQLVGALEGLALQISNLVGVNERVIATLDRLEMTSRGLTDELAALRMERAHGGNGHAKHHDLASTDSDS